MNQKQLTGLKSLKVSAGEETKTQRKFQTGNEREVSRWVELLEFKNGEDHRPG